MKKIYLIITFIIISLASLYAMFGRTLKQTHKDRETLLPANAMQRENVSTTALKSERAQEQLILGTWILEEDTLSKCVYKSDGICYKYYANELTTTYAYNISSATPQCGFEVSTGPNLSYLEWVDTKNESDKFCFDIGGLSDSVLNIRLLGTGDFAIYIRPNYSGTGSIYDLPVYYNVTKSQSFAANNCEEGQIATTVVYTVPAGKYSSTISQADADKKALQDIQQNGQQYANEGYPCYP